MALLIGAILGHAAFAQSKAPASPAKSPARLGGQPAKSAASKNQTSTAKKPAKSKRPVARRSRGQSAPTAERIREVQSALAGAGFYPGEPTGKWDASSADALKRFQQANALTPTGKLDARTLQKLGLGSPVAGVSPPRTNGERSSSTNPN
jgi:peptidoglycan hydrolase-like protein with peptidoglycan-binding domain